MAYIKCKCSYKRSLTIVFFMKIIGKATTISIKCKGIRHFCVNTGFTLPLCISILTGGIGILVFSDEITKWLVNKGYKCPSCQTSNWQIIK